MSITKPEVDISTSGIAPVVLPYATVIFRYSSPGVGTGWTYVVQIGVRLVDQTAQPGAKCGIYDCCERQV